MLEGENETLFEKFVIENIEEYGDEIDQIQEYLISINEEVGARGNFFTEAEGRNICTLHDLPGKKLRLYFICYGTTIVILGGGGPKPKDIITLQQSPKLKKENYLLRDIEKLIRERIDFDEIEIDDIDLTGNLDFYED